MTSENVGRVFGEADLTWSPGRPSLPPAETVPCAEQEAFYKAEFLPLVRHVLRATGSTDLDEAKNAAQEAFVKLLPRWGDVTHHRAWLRKVAVREFFRRPVHLPVEQIPERTGPDDAAGTAERRRQQRLVIATLQELPYKQREALAWLYDGFKPVEIAAILEQEPAAVRQNLAKARRNVKALNQHTEEAS
ncbi:sigma-70 family RNA polymerase sigma factor [Actinomadura sp. NAK00032]|uniref:RNA polymerase sigma factor n=1 Tax=Actinomadura sp. NAK00032 TaxID=2742128 RepID=UPI001590A264|nr:sigma factor-like helix-turn-helix DNA-binding protein [Actinomadura sp. NAK00032]QKW36250.1 sigma-70 family RNA polymerase sigma factor [Actinomadura sp. NAK00032]